MLLYVKHARMVRAGQGTLKWSVRHYRFDNDSLKLDEAYQTGLETLDHTIVRRICPFNDMR